MFLRSAATNVLGRDSGTIPGGVIDFVEQLRTIEDADGEKVFAVGMDSLQNWIMPLRLRSDFNISLGVLERGRLYRYSGTGC